MFLFDFDGVLINSVKEVALTAYNAVTNNRITKLEQIPSPYIDLFIYNSDNYHSPVTLYVLAKWCLENYEQKLKKLDRADFKRYYESFDIDSRTFNDQYFSIRESLINMDLENWAKLNEPYQPIWKTLQESGAENLIILTAKNHEAVKVLSDYYNLGLKSENIYSGDGGVSKIENFRVIEDRFKLDQYSFIDDHLKNLLDIDEAFNVNGKKYINLILCSWGYGHVDDYEIARAKGYKVLGQDEFIPLLKA